MKEILCLGDSLTKGRVGHSFTEYLTNQKIINKGKDGDTLYHSYKRLKKYLNQDKFKNVDTYIISLGTNDILIPFLKNLTPLWYLIMKPREDFFHCLQDDKSFEENDAELLSHLAGFAVQCLLFGRGTLFSIIHEIASFIPLLYQIAIMNTISFIFF